MSDLYDTDFRAWAETQTGLLRDRFAAALDWDNLADEIEALARNDRREIKSRFEVLAICPWTAEQVLDHDSLARRLKIRESRNLRIARTVTLAKAALSP